MLTPSPVHCKMTAKTFNIKKNWNEICIVFPKKQQQRPLAFVLAPLTGIEPTTFRSQVADHLPELYSGCF